MDIIYYDDKKELLGKFTTDELIEYLNSKKALEKPEIDVSDSISDKIEVLKKLTYIDDFTVSMEDKLIAIAEHLAKFHYIY